ncbi:TRAP transporter substrate-binding protein DctP [Moorellaceae bacterium AZ2]
MKLRLFLRICPMLMLLALILVGGCGSKQSSAPGQGGQEPQKSQEVIKLKYACTYQKTEEGALIGYKFCDYVEERSGGRVKFERYPGGVLGGAPEILRLVSSGSVDVVSFPHVVFKDELPLSAIPEWSSGAPEKAVEYFNKIFLEIPETSPLLEQEAQEHNIKYLRFVSGGCNVFVSKKEINSLADLKGKKLGAGAAQEAFAKLGVTVVNVTPPDIYEDFSRGIIDVTHMGFGPTVQLKWYEVAKCWVFDGTYTAGNPITVNLNTWNKLPPDIQQIFIEGAKAASDYSIELAKNTREQNIQTLKNAGAVVKELSPAEAQQWFQNIFEYGKKDMLERATKAGKAEQAKIILKHVEEQLGMSK